MVSVLFKSKRIKWNGLKVYPNKQAMYVDVRQFCSYCGECFTTYDVATFLAKRPLVMPDGSTATYKGRKRDKK